mmetsp:Transcript_17487/g.26301  ORF Transcript_17487/g.26301 Transcript_17487/m.26301 type:complete len:304 (+) Transcript_17487:302-1213(+)
MLSLSLSSLCLVSGYRGATLIFQQNYRFRLGGVVRLSRSTATFDDSLYVDGYEKRRALLDEALNTIGFDSNQLYNDTRLAGSAAVRTYRSFVLPKSRKALAMANQPQRATTVAAQIAFMTRETVANQSEWLRNRDRNLNTLDEMKRQPYELTIILDAIRSGENVGSIIRTAETAGAVRVLACGTTPFPPTPSVIKAACRSADYIACDHIPSAVDAVIQLQAKGVVVWALETTENAVSLHDIQVPKAPLAIVLGNELVGISPDVIQRCNQTVLIPTFGIKNSMNVAAAAAVTTFEIVRQWSSLS